MINKKRCILLGFCLYSRSGEHNIGRIIELSGLNIVITRGMHLLDNYHYNIENIGLLS